MKIWVCRKTREWLFPRILQPSSKELYFTFSSAQISPYSCIPEIGGLLLWKLLLIGLTFVYLLQCLHLQSLLYNLAQHVLHVRPGTKHQVLWILLRKMCIWENGNLSCIFSLCFWMFVYNSLAVQLHFKKSTLWDAFFTPNIFLVIFWFPGWVGCHYSVEEGTESMPVWGMFMNLINRDWFCQLGVI